jgi:hypothetical protein
MTHRSLALLAASLIAACGDSSTKHTPDAPATPLGEHVAILEGALLDPTVARGTHDTGAMAAQPIAMGAGDLAHIVGLGAQVLNTDPNYWLVIDRWAQPDGMDAFYNNPNVQQGLAGLVSAPKVTEFHRETAWYSWGDFDAAAAAPRWYVIVRGRFKDLSTAQASADAGAKAAEPTARMLGDAAHIAFTGRADSAEFLAIDIWTRPDQIAAFYSDPNFQQGAQQIFVSGITTTVLHSTNWYQWGSDGESTLDGTWRITSLTCAGASQQLGDFHFQVRANAGTFIQVFDPTGCVANYTESYAYSGGTGFTITADSITCNPNSTCQTIIGASCLPTPPPTDFTWTLSADSLVFNRTATGPGDLPCKVGDAMVFTMSRMTL